MGTFRASAVIFVIAIASQGAFAADVAHLTLPPDVLLQLEGKPLPPMSDLLASGLIPGQVADSKSIVSEMGFITQWLSHYNMLPGFLDEDVVDEASIGPVCYGNRLTESENAPYLYRYYWTSQQISTGYYNAYNDAEVCATDYTDLVRYLVTQVKSPIRQPATLFVGADDGIKVWLNGAEVMRHEEGEYLVDQYRAEVQLEPGWNLVVVKLYYPMIGPSDDPSYETKYWSLRFADAAGENPLHLAQATDGWCDHDQSYQWVYAGGAADLPGAQGSQWASDLRLTNPYHYPLELTLQYFEEGSVAAAPAKAAPATAVLAPPKAVAPDAEQTIVLEPFESRAYRRVLTSLFGVTPPQKGMIAIRGYYSSDAQYYGAVELRTYNQGGGGTFGTVIPMTYLYGGNSCCSMNLYGLRNGPDSRTNIGMSPRRVFDSEIEFTVTIWDSVTGAFAQKSFVGNGNFQLNDIFAKLGLGDLVTDTAMAYINWNSNSSGAYYRFSASVVDNKTSDPVDVSPGTYLYPPPLQ
jgi:hypothetical protein